MRPWAPGEAVGAGPCGQAPTAFYSQDYGGQVRRVRKPPGGVACDCGHQSDEVLVARERVGHVPARSRYQSHDARPNRVVTNSTTIP